MDDPAVTETTHVHETESVALDATGTAVDADGGLLRMGACVGRYVIDTHVGAGGMGRIYAAHDPELDRKVAIKLLRAERDDEVGRDRLLLEARSLAKLAHPHVVAVHDVGTVGDRVFVAMEYVSGTTLERVLAQRRHGWREVLELMIPVARGLAAVHAAGLVHRDLKPANVMRGDDGRVRLMDFGLARGSAHDAREDEATGSGTEGVRAGNRLTRTGSRIGTPPYMAPEQWRGEVADARTDQFAFCVTVWEALYGERPFAGRTIAQLERTITSGLVSAHTRGPGAPRWLHRALLRGLAVDPTDRHPSMDALIELLVNERRRARTRWIASMGALVATVAAGIGIGAMVEPTDTVAASVPERLAQCEANEVCARGPLEIPVCTRTDGNPASGGIPCTPGSNDSCPERESCMAIVRPEGESGRCMPVCQVQDDRPECVPGCYNQQCAGNFELCVREHGTCRPVPCTSDEQCSKVAACDFPQRGSPGFRCNVEAGFCERNRS